MSWDVYMDRNHVYNLFSDISLECSRGMGITSLIPSISYKFGVLNMDPFFEMMVWNGQLCHRRHQLSRKRMKSEPRSIPMRPGHEKTSSRWACSALIINHWIWNADFFRKHVLNVMYSTVSTCASYMWTDQGKPFGRCFQCLSLLVWCWWWWWWCWWWWWWWRCGITYFLCTYLNADSLT